MAEKPVLVIMAAGMGSRYGGLKQIEPMDDQGHIIMDFSLYDARKAGFEKVIFIIKEENEALFREAIGNRVSQQMEVAYAFQKLDDLPESFAVPEGRVKPWGTAHAVLAARDLIHGPFVVINADDYYGEQAFAQIYRYLSTHQDDEQYRFAMIGYILENTLTENGSVARGCCDVTSDGMLSNIVERTKIKRTPQGAAYTEDDGATWVEIDTQSLISMNMWGFSKSMVAELEKGFPIFLGKNLSLNPLKCEYFLPLAVEDLLKAGKATVQVLSTPDRWYGVTYKEDRPMVVEAFARMKAEGKYPEAF